MTRQKKSRREAGRIPLPETAEQEQRQRRVAQNKLKARQRSQFDQLQDKQRQDSDDSPTTKAPTRKSRLKRDSAAVAQRSQQLMEQTSQSFDETDTEQSND